VTDAVVKVSGGSDLLNWCASNYLGVAAHEEIKVRLLIDDGCIDWLWLK
jgi:hypothetical protein